MNTPIRLPRLFALIVLAAALTAAACSSGAAATTSPAGPSASPSAPGSADPGGGGGGSAGEPGSGDLPSAVDPGPVDPDGGNPKLVIPRPGQLNPHPVAAMSMEPNVDGRHVTVKLTWYSGVEPCYVLDSVKVEQAGGEIILTIIEGSSDLDTACIEIAMLKATIVDLGELAPGQYTISSPGGEAQPVIITVV